MQVLNWNIVFSEVGAKIFFSAPIIFFQYQRVDEANQIYTAKKDQKKDHKI